MERRPSRPIRQSVTKPKLTFGMVPTLPFFFLVVAEAWFLLVPQAWTSLVAFVGVFLWMWRLTVKDPHWSDIARQKAVSWWSRVVRTRGRSLRLRKYMAAR